MRTRILSLLLALLAISNLSFAQNKHLGHTVGFSNATNKCYTEVNEEPVPEKNPLADLFNNEFPSIKTLLNTETETMCMVITKHRYEAITEICNSETHVTDNYCWIFSWDEFCEKCKDGQTLSSYFSTNNSSPETPFVKNLAEDEHLQNSIYRLHMFLGLDITNPLHTYFCKFETPAKQIFRPAYVTDITKDLGSLEKNPEGDLWKFDLSYLEGKYSDEFKVETSNNDLVNSAADENVKNGTSILTPQRFLANIQNQKEYPWTRLGFTYDWGKKYDAKNFDNIGISEFIVLPNTKISNMQIVDLEANKIVYKQAQ